MAANATSLADRARKALEMAVDKEAEAAEKEANEAKERAQRLLEQKAAAIEARKKAAAEEQLKKEREAAQQKNATELKNATEPKVEKKAALIRSTASKKVGKTVAKVVKKGVVDPCASITCPALTCPGGTLMKAYPGHCCQYCESQVVIKDDTDYSKAAAEAYASYKTAPYAR